MADEQSYIGGTLSVAKGAKPTSENKAGYDALTWVEVGKVVSLGAVGDTHENITVTTLKGRTLNITGAADGGSSEMTLVADGDDSGQVDLVEINGSNTQSSFRIVDPEPSNSVSYFSGLIASLKDTPRDTSSYRGLTCDLKINTKVTDGT